MKPAKLVIRGSSVVLPSSVQPAAIHISDGVISSITPFADVPPDVDLVEAGTPSIVMPGLVDSHVHINEPGRTHWEGFATATRAAAAGGITTVVDMPLNSIPPTTTLQGFEEKLNAAEGQCYVDTGFWGGVIPGNVAELAALSSKGVVGFKCFLVHSGVDEFPNVTEADLRLALPELVRLNAVLIVHAEVPGPIERSGVQSCHHAPDQRSPDELNTKYQTFLQSRPRAAEDEACDMMIRLAREFDARIHIVHHSSASSLPTLARAKKEGVKLTVETCPHYLSFVAEDIPDGATEFKCCPPVRERENSDQLWDALKDRVIDMVVSDHSPCPPELKLRDRGDFLCAWGGISSLQLRLPIVWTEALQRRFSLNDLARWLCEAPAELVGLGNRKGKIAPGYDADLVVWHPHRGFTVAGEKLEHRHKITPYEGRRLRGVVEKTFLRGEKIYDDGEITGPRGMLLI